MPTDQTQPSLHSRLERQLNAVTLLSRRWRWYESDLKSALKAITETAAAALAIDRVSVWLLDDARQSIICQDMYEQSRHRHTRGFKLARRDHPEYFKALETEDVVDATDAHTDPRTRSFRDGYLVPNGIGAMLDTPVRVGGRLTGVVCHEHVGGPRLFLADEQGTARYLANLVSLACELQGRAETEEKVERALALFRAAVESAGVGVFAMDEQGKLSFANKAAQDIWRFTDEMVAIGTGPEKRLEHSISMMKDPAAVVDRLAHVRLTPDAILDRLRIELKDGRMLETSSRPQVVHGKIVGRVWTVRDVTSS